MIEVLRPLIIKKIVFQNENCWLKTIFYANNNNIRRNIFRFIFLIIKKCIYAYPLLRHLSLLVYRRRRLLFGISSFAAFRFVATCFDLLVFVVAFLSTTLAFIFGFFGMFAVSPTDGSASRFFVPISFFLITYTYGGGIYSVCGSKSGLIGIFVTGSLARRICGYLTQGLRASS